MDRLISIVSKIMSAVVYSGAVMMMVSVVLATINALARKFLNTSFPWTEEICMYLVVMGFFFTIPYLTLKGDQLSVDLLRSLVKNKLVIKIFYIFFGCLELALFIMLVKFGLISTSAAEKSGVLTNYMHLPKYLLYGTVVVTYSLSILSLLASFILNKGESFK